MPTTTAHVSINEILERRLVTSVYQPIVDLMTREVVAYEALARGPKDTNLEQPDALFDAADELGVRTELDWECRSAAVRGAVKAGMGRETCLFINLEASSFGSEPPPHNAAEIRSALTQLNVVAEVTERDLGHDPATLLSGVAALRDRGFGIAIDDLGANANSLALLPFLEPDIIKLDMALIQSGTTAAIASMASAVRSDAERRGTMIVAEGIESDEHLHRALVLGATHGQGWLFARPGPLPIGIPGQSSTLWEGLRRSHHVAPATPWDLVEGSDTIRVASKDMLLPMSELIEQYPVPTSERPVLLAAFQHARNFSPATILRYADLATTATFVGALGEGLSKEPAPGVRGGSVAPGHALCGEWTVVNAGPHYTSALIAHDLGDSGPESDRRFRYVITHDRTTVLSAAASLLRLIQAPDTPQRRATD